MQSYFVALPLCLSPQQLKEVVEAFNGEWQDDPLHPSGFILVGWKGGQVIIEALAEEDEIYTDEFHDDQIVEMLIGKPVRQTIAVQVSAERECYILGERVAAYIAWTYGGYFDGQLDP